MTEELQKREPMAIGHRGLKLTNLDDLWRFSTALAKSGLAPKGIQTPEAITIAIQMGMELGMTPMAAIQNIAVVNGRPSIYGDAALAVVRASGQLETYSETYEGEGEDRCCIVRSKRKGQETELVSWFSVEDAKRAKLWGKPGPWTEYPDRMLKFRARGFNLRDNFGDVLKGYHTVEEMRDAPIVEVVSETITAEAPEGFGVKAPEADAEIEEEPKFELA